MFRTGDYPRLATQIQSVLQEKSDRLQVRRQLPCRRWALEQDADAAVDAEEAGEEVEEEEEAGENCRDQSISGRFR